MHAADSQYDERAKAAVPSSRVPDCPHASACAGCPLIGLSYEEQLARKHDRIVGALARHAELAQVATEPCVGAEPNTGYRTRAKLMVGSGPRIGLYGREGGHVVVDIPECVVLAPELRDVANALRGLLASPPENTGSALVPFDATSKDGALVAIDLREIREIEGEVFVLVTLVFAAERPIAAEQLLAAAALVRAAAPRVIGVAANYRAPGAPQVLGPETKVLSGLEVARDRMGQAVQLVSYGSFVQAHRGQAARIHELLARELAGAGGGLAGMRILDLYGGSGAIGLSLAKAGAAVTIVESFPKAAEGARLAAEDQALAQVRVLSGDVAPQIAQLAAAGSRFDAIVANPPRRGLTPEVRSTIARLAPEIVAYVSCDPDTLTRDLGHFARLGYATSRVSPFDMIPLTEEVETVAVLRRAPAWVPKVLYEDDDVLVIDKPAHEPTTPQGEHVSSLLERVRREMDLPLAVPVHRLDIGTSGLLIIAKRAEHVAAWRKALSAGRKIYLAAVRGITPIKGAIARPLRDGERMLEARTRYRRLAVLAGHSLLRAFPEEGRTHQIRRHLKGIGHPVLGDERYGHLPSNRHFLEKYGLDRTFLHCVRLELEHPRTGEKLVLESSLPGDLRGVLERTSGREAVERLSRCKSLGCAGS